MGLFKRAADKIIQKQVDKRKSEIEQRIKEEESKILIAHKENIKEEENKLLAIYKSRTQQLETLIKDVERVKFRAEDEQKRLWERLDILRDSLNADQIFSKLWGMAYSKAVDVVWDLFKEETKHLVTLSKQDGYNQGELSSKTSYDRKLNELIKSSTDGVNIPLLFKRRDEANEKYLVSQKSKDIPRESFYKGQIELIEEITNGKKT